ncbi:MAG TPA: NUDIX hydrolase [Patescibacteria group bacterium]|nr:NUDIX hydrolase [Patescibacteria group bacterium]
MKINGSFKWNNKDINFTYKDIDSFSDIPLEKIRQCYGVCFYQNKIVLGVYKDHWSLIGGTREKGEKPEETLRREILEESNMELINYLPIGFQYIPGDGSNDFYQLRYICKVKPYGDFVKDPGGNVTGIEIINSEDFLNYVKWGKVGERILERAIELKDKI